MRNSSGSLVARINSNGDVRDSNNHLIARLDGNTVRNSNNSSIGLQNRYNNSYFLFHNSNFQPSTDDHQF